MIDIFNHRTQQILVIILCITVIAFGAKTAHDDSAIEDADTLIQDTSPDDTETKKEPPAPEREKDSEKSEEPDIDTISAHDESAHNPPPTVFDTQNESFITEPEVDTEESDKIHDVPDLPAQEEHTETTPQEPDIDTISAHDESTHNTPPTLFDTQNESLTTEPEVDTEVSDKIHDTSDLSSQEEDPHTAATSQEPDMETMGQSDRTVESTNALSQKVSPAFFDKKQESFITELEPESDTPDEAEPLSDDQQEENKEEEEVISLPLKERIIRTIAIEGNKRVSPEAIRARILYNEGEQFNPLHSSKVIRNLYYNVQQFKNVSLEVEEIGHDQVDLYVIVEEKPILKDVTFNGNTKVTEKEIEKKVDFKDIPTINEVELQKYAKIIRHIYVEKGYFSASVDSHLTIDGDYATAVFDITEGEKSFIRQIKFVGNNNISGKQLRAAIFSKEDWILGFVEGSGAYHPDRLEADKHFIEQFYQNNGYLNAKVTKVDTWLDPKTSKVTITFDIEEGEQYTIKDVRVSGNGIIKDEYLEERIPLKSGDIYSREKMVDAMKGLEHLWSDMGYMYSHIEPALQPDDEAKTISIAFNTELGSPVYLNKVTVRGNKKTRDKIIRRQFRLEEGGLITTQAMEVSKNRVQALGYFDQKDGVNWKTTRISEELADLDLIVKETKTGNAHIKLGFGGVDDIRSAVSGVSLEGNISDSNLFGSGIQFNLVARLAKGEQDLLFNLTQPWLFDKPIFGALDASHKRIGYDQLRFAQSVNELRTNGSGTIGFATGWPRFPFFNDTFVRITGGADKVRYERPAIASSILTGDARTEYQSVLNKLFEPGSFGWITIQMGQDKKNHPMHPSNGYTWLMRTQFAIPGFNANIGFTKFDLDANWFTPLIGDYDLVFRLHGYMGFAMPLKNRLIPYRDLFHIGGPASVRGFLYGQVGPQFTTLQNNVDRASDSIGGKKAVFFNAELIFPITPDLTMKGLVFYDGGTGWNNPYSKDISAQFLRNNTFNYRHSIGFGVRILQPMPIRIDWGYKIDPRKGESGHEVHFSMNYDW